MIRHKWVIWRRMGTKHQENTYANGLLDALLLIFDDPNSNTGGV